MTSQEKEQLRSNVFVSFELKRQPHKMVKHTQTIRWQ